MRSIPLARVCAALFVVAAGACSDATAPGATPVDLKAALSEMSITPYLPSATGIGSPVGFGAPSAASCAYDGSLQSFVCAPFTTAGLTFNSSYVLLSASGAPLAAFDPAATAAIRSTSTAAGTLDTGGSPVSPLQIDERQVMTLSGLLTGTHVLDGTLVAHITEKLATQNSDAILTMTVAGLVLPEHPGPNSYPRAGTITTSYVEPAFGNLPSSTFTIAMKFNGTSKVDVTMSGFGADQHCVVDLAAQTTRGNFGCSATP